MAKLSQMYLFAGLMILNLYTLPARAQSLDDEERTFFGGLTAGANFSQVDGDNFAGYHRVGWNAGVVVFAKLSGSFAGGMELLFAQKGSRAGQNQLPKWANDQSTVLTDYKIQLNYAEVPVTINYFDKRRNHFGAGLAYAQLVSSKEKYRDGQGLIYEQDAKLFPFKKFDLSCVLTGSAHLWKGFYMNIRFQYSLLTVRNSYNFLTGRPEQYNNLWCTRLVYLF